jgi:hypothetical protein
MHLSSVTQSVSEVQKTASDGAGSKRPQKASNETKKKIVRKIDENLLFINIISSSNKPNIQLFLLMN